MDPTMKLPIPEDLEAFLKAKKQLSCDWKLAQTGEVRLFSLDRLRISGMYSAPRGMSDPNRRRRGVYRIPAISLTARCKKYDPAHLLSYLPFENLYATFDGDHAVVTVFTRATWTDIAANPLPYLNANWDRSRAVPASRRTQWHERYAFFKDAFE